MQRTRPWIQQLTPFMLAGALLILTAMSIAQVLGLRQDLAQAMERQLKEEIRDRVESWETHLLSRLTEYNQEARRNPIEAGVLQHRLRSVHPWFDAFYIWQPTEIVSSEGTSERIGGLFVFPQRPLIEHPDVYNKVPCLGRGRAFASQPMVDPIDAANAWVQLCRRQDASVRTLALTQAISVLLHSKLFNEADLLMVNEGFPQSTSLHDLHSMGIPTFMGMILQIQRSEIYENTHRIEAYHNLSFRIGLEITGLDAPDAEPLLTYVSFPILDRLEKAGLKTRVKILKDNLARARRRVKGFHEVQTNMLPRPAPQRGDAPRFVQDQYGEEPFLLFTDWPEGSTLGASIQLDQSLLIEDFLRSITRYRSQIVVTDATHNHRVAGVERDSPIVATLPFSKTLTHLRIGIHEEAFTRRLSRLQGVWVMPAILLGMVVLMGLLSLFEQVRATQQQAKLLRRQREFATRVTHELKTPLAGIKVMAESIELGMYKNDNDLHSMASSIIKEADTLTDRVNEILAVTKERELRSRERFDPEEPLFEAIDQWGPRLERANIRFEADLHPTDEILGDPTAVRDAVSCLLDNAMKYRRTDIDEPWVRLRLRQRGTDVLIEVTDNGLGVPSGMRAQVFEQFVRVEGDNRGKSGGHGIGLAQVEAILKAHRGSAWCEEGKDGGSTFVLRFPTA